MFTEPPPATPSTRSTPDQSAPDDLHRRPTNLLDYEHPSIQQLIDTRGWAAGDESTRIAAIYTYVRDEILFGYNSSDDVPASAVLADGYGQCNTKSTLLIALLRAAGISTRFHGATIHKRLQQGIVNGLFYRIAPSDIVHSWAEVWHRGRWVGLEGVILDRAYLTGLRARFPERTTDFLGYGVGTDNLANPPIDWCGTDTAIQATGINHNHGAFDDPDTFYNQHGTNLTGIKAQLFARWLRHAMNHKVRAIRSHRAGPAPDDRAG